MNGGLALGWMAGSCFDLLVDWLVGIVVWMIEFWVGRLDSWLVGKLVAWLVAGLLVWWFLT